MNYQKLEYNPDMDLPFVRCHNCDESELAPVIEDTRNDFMTMFKADDGTVLCQKCKEKFDWLDEHKNESWLSALVEFGKTFNLGVDETAEIYNQWHEARP